MIACQRRACKQPVDAQTSCVHCALASTPHLEVKVLDIILTQAHHQAVQLSLAVSASSKPTAAAIARCSRWAQHRSARSPACC